MPIPKPNLDDRHFQEIVDEAKGLITTYCPEWTDHNVSDPGVALIELFAWMTDMLLYRVNQVPDKIYLTLLDLMGVQLQVPRAAQTPVTFYLSAPQPDLVTIPVDTEVATIRTETTPAIIFSTEQDLMIRPAQLLGLYTRTRTTRAGVVPWVAHDLNAFNRPRGSVTIFPKNPLPEDMFYVSFESDLSNHVLALIITCDEARGAGIDPTNPPYVWEVWAGPLLRWVPAEMEFDGTMGFNQSGEIILRLPAMVQDSVYQITAYWIRCRLRTLAANEQGYEISPDITSFRAESRGGTVGARHAVTVNAELIGRSEGVPGQVFKLLYAPVLNRHPETDYLEVDPPLPGKSLRWEEQSDFANSSTGDQHYTLDGMDGTISFGPTLVQPDGSVQSFGAIPPRGSSIRFSRYQYGGGVIGNVSPHALSVPKTSIPYVARVTNWREARGGRDAESLENVMLRAPQVLRTRTRAMTAEDYEYLAGEVPGVARACCLGPGSQPGASNDPKPGQVLVYVLPRVDNPQQRISSENVTLAADLSNTVKRHLDARRPLGIAMDVLAAQVLWVTADVKVRLPLRSDPSLAAQVRERAIAAIHAYINPYIGGPDGHGWPFGRDLHVSEIYAMVQRIPSVEFVEEVKLFLADTGGGQARPAGQRIDVPANAVVCSYEPKVIAEAVTS